MNALRRAWSRLSRLFRKAAKEASAAPLPPRFEEAVQLFRLRNPEASPEAWHAFAVGLASQAYGQGIRRGLDAAKGVPAKELATRHDWRPGERLPWLAAALARRDPHDPFGDVSLADRRAFVNGLAAAVRAGVDVRIVPDSPKALGRASSRS